MPNIIRLTTDGIPRKKEFLSIPIRFCCETFGFHADREGGSEFTYICTGYAHVDSSKKGLTQKEE